MKIAVFTGVGSRMGKSMVKVSYTSMESATMTHSGRMTSSGAGESSSVRTGVPTKGTLLTGKLMVLVGLYSKT